MRIDLLRPAAAITLALVAASFPAQAQDGHDDAPGGLTYSVGSLDINLTLDAGLGVFAVGNAQNGAGSSSQNSLRQGRRDWAEGFVAPGLGLAYNLGDSSLYGGVTAIGSFTRGDGDAQLNSSTSDRPEALSLSELYAGWKSGIALASLGEDAVDFSVGRQGFVVGDGFLIADGTAEGFRRAAYVMGPNGSFDRTAIVRLNTQPVRADIFHLQGNVDQDFMTGNDAAATKLYGANVEWFGSSHQDHGRFEFEERAWYLGATLLRLYDADRGVAARRDGMDVYAVRTGGTLFAALGEGFEDFALFSEYAVQRNDNAGRKLRANAWYIEPEYTFSALPWTPRLSYRYAHFSGDSDSNDATSKTWDSLYTGGGPRGFGSWDQGEIYARYVAGNSNLNTHMVHLRGQPMEEVAIGAVYYLHRYDEPGQAGVTSDELMTEVNLYAEWETPVPGLGVAAILGAAKAGSGRKQELAATAGTAPASETTYLGAVTLIYSF